MPQQEVSYPQEGQSNCTMYTSVQREWIKGKEAQREASPKPVDEHVQDPASVMMQRWHQETMRDQPYQNIGAVERMSPYGDTNQTFYQRRDDSSVRHTEHDDKGSKIGSQTQSHILG
ncbi:MAG: hypothetical protein M1824_002449 [Vezdaea acicularis]|nr:MAG: hypothetical protein M1824_002449 [Vezdaea acicularis]